MEGEGEISCIPNKVCHKVVLISAGASHSVALLGMIFIYLRFYVNVVFVHAILCSVGILFFFFFFSIFVDAKWRVIWML